MRIGLHYSFQSRERKWSEAYKNVVDQILLADKLGFDTITVPEQHFLSDGFIPSPIVACAGLSTLLKHARVGTNAIVLGLHNPIRVCEDSLVANMLANGRFILGVCLGNWKEPFDKLGIPHKERRFIFEEALHLVRKLLTEDNVTYEGEYFKYRNITLTPKPAHQIPIWVAAIEEPAIRRAARMGDAWIPNQTLSLKQLKEGYAAYKDELERHEKKFDELERPLRREACVAENDDAAREECHEAYEYQYGEIYFKKGWGVMRDDSGKRVTPENTTVEEVMNMMHRRFLVGGPDDFIAGAEKYEKELGVDLLLLGMPGLRHQAVMKSIELIGKKVIPYFNDQKK